MIPKTFGLPLGKASFIISSGVISSIDYILKIQPLFFVFENVRNLWNNNDHKKRLKRILKKVEKEYYIDHKILNSINFGVPQDRNRLFIVGIKKSENSKNDFLELEFNFPWPHNDSYTNALHR